MSKNCLGFLGGGLAGVLIIWLGGFNSPAPPVSIRPLRPALSGLQPTSASTFGSIDPYAAALADVRTQVRHIKQQLRQSREVEASLREAISATRAAKVDEAAADAAAAATDAASSKDLMEHVTSATADDSSSSADQSESTQPLAASKTCPAGCTRHGNCDAVTGTCSCPPTYAGESCDQPTMPSCATSPTAAGGSSDEDGIVNLSGMAAEQFWWMLRDVKVRSPPHRSLASLLHSRVLIRILPSVQPNPAEDARRRKPPFRYVGFVTCQCVREAVQVLSLARSPEPAAWPRYIGHTEIAMQRAVCVDAAGSGLADSRVGGLWARAPNSEQLRWSYVPLVAWLKPYPAHSPQLLPFGMVGEKEFTDGSRGDAHLMYLQHKAAAKAMSMPLPPPPPLTDMLPLIGRMQLRPPSRCGPHMCHHAGWCGVWMGRWARKRGGAPRASCHCLSAWASDSHSMRLAEGQRRWEGPGDGPVSQRSDGGPEPQMEAVALTCGPQPRVWETGMEKARFARTPAQMTSHDAAHSQHGIDRWRVAQPTIPRAKACPNECLGRGQCAYGFCHCQPGYWGLDCGFSKARLQQLARAKASPRIYVYEVPAALRRECAPWTLPGDLGDRLLQSDYLEPDPERADLFWVYGCPNGDTVMPMLRWIKRTFPFWKQAVSDGEARHVIAVGHEEGWSEVWQLLGRWLGPNFDHPNQHHNWDDLHPASFTRQLAAVQLHGGSDYTADLHALRRGVSGGASCRVCFQPGKDIAVPGFPGIMDYPDDHGRPALYQLNGDQGRVSQCTRLARERPYLEDGVTLAPRKNSPKMLMAGVVQTKTHGPGLYEASRLVPFNCWKNRSKVLASSGMARVASPRLMPAPCSHCSSFGCGAGE